MGLDIRFGNLEQTLAAQYSGFPRQKARTKRAKELLLKDIHEQTGSVCDLREANVAAKYRAMHIRFGSYSALHILRVCACRLAGFTLDAAYDLPERSISVLGTSELESGDEEKESDSSEELTAEQEIERTWDFDLDKVCPLSSNSITPFPFSQLVCFSDAEGIYIPTKFREPIILDDYFIGSSIQLNEELSEVARQLRINHNAAPNEEPNVQEFFVVVKSLLAGLRNPCLVSVRNRFSMLFE